MTPYSEAGNRAVNTGDQTVPALFLGEAKKTSSFSSSMDILVKLNCSEIIRFLVAQ